MVLIGPGSEWLWIALQFFALSITGLAILRQVRLQAAADSLAVGIRFADSFRIELTPFRLAALIDVSRNSRTMTPAIELVGNWFDGTASAIEHGYLPARMGWQEWGQVSQTFWAVFAPVREERRAVEPSLWRDWERWVDDSAARDRKAGNVQDVSSAVLARWVPEAIAYYVASLRLQEEARRGVIQTWPIPEASSESKDERSEPSSN